jgi:hypothetical protein
MKQRPEFFSNFGWPDYLFYLQKLPDPPAESIGCPKTNQEINEPSYEMVGVHLGKSKQNQEISELKILVGTNVSHVQTV